ncbi:hypothetical protein TH53_23675 [Pedobacter lusitanus]|uniref:BTB domain-containing protein n=1 Tax=Pedobacter lusitanus TaxID=1503925 RepID=A0A0D0GC72_9SPHI|nr:S8 family serine peptidase [Pedobacter lusitanus]KIO74887.1 hypothetical protein TH53_23675 [Pedobacter lusitanus]
MNIAIIDSGLDIHNQTFKNKVINGVHISLNRDSSFEIDSNYAEYTNGHGTAIAELISEIDPEANLFIVKISSFDKKLTEGLIVMAFEYCNAHYHIDIYNVSLGILTKNPGNKLYSICREIVNKGAIIISSAHYHPNIPCYPAFFPFVFSVATGVSKADLNEFLYLGEGNINVIGHGVKQQVTWCENCIEEVAGSSYATARFSGTLSRLLRDNPGFTAGRLPGLLSRFSSENVKQLYFIDRENIEVQLNETYVKEEDTKEVQILFYPFSDKKFNRYFSSLTYSSEYIRILFDEQDALKHKKIAGVHLTDLTNTELEKFKVIIGDVYNSKIDLDLECFMSLTERLISSNVNIYCLNERVYNYIHSIISKDDVSYKGKLVNLHSHFSRKDKNIVDKAEPPKEKPIVAVSGIDAMENLILTSRLRSALSEVYQLKSSIIVTCNYGLLEGGNVCIPYQRSDAGRIDFKQMASIVDNCISNDKCEVIFTYDQGLPNSNYLNNYIYNNKTLALTLEYFTSVIPDLFVFSINGTYRYDETINYITRVTNFFSLKASEYIIVYSNIDRISLLNELDNKINNKGETRRLFCLKKQAKSACKSIIEKFIK